MVRICSGVRCHGGGGGREPHALHSRRGSPVGLCAWRPDRPVHWRSPRRRPLGERTTPALVSLPQLYASSSNEGIRALAAMSGGSCGSSARVKACEHLRAGHLIAASIRTPQLCADLPLLLTHSALLGVAREYLSAVSGRCRSMRIRRGRASRATSQRRCTGHTATAASRSFWRSRRSTASLGPFSTHALATTSLSSSRCALQSTTPARGVWY